MLGRVDGAQGARGRGFEPQWDTPSESGTHTRPPLAVLLQGMSTDQAQTKFCRVYAEAHTAERAALNFHGSHRT